MCFTQVLVLSNDVRQIKALSGDHGEHFNRTVTEVEVFGQDCQLCRKVEADLLKLKSQSQDALGQMQSSINIIQMRLESERDGCFQKCSHLEEEVRLLRVDIRSCTGQCKNNPDATKGQFNFYFIRFFNLSTN